VITFLFLLLWLHPSVTLFPYTTLFRSVGRNFKTEVKQVISNDLEYYSYVLNKNYIGNHHSFEYQNLIEELNALPGIKGFVFEERSEEHTSELQSRENLVCRLLLEKKK